MPECWFTDILLVGITVFLRLMSFKGHLVPGKPKDWKKNVFIDYQSLKDIDIYLENMSRRRDSRLCSVSVTWCAQDFKNRGHKGCKNKWKRLWGASLEKWTSPNKRNTKLRSTDSITRSLLRVIVMHQAPLCMISGCDIEALAAREALLCCRQSFCKVSCLKKEKSSQHFQTCKISEVTQLSCRKPRHVVSAVCCCWASCTRTVIWSASASFFATKRRVFFLKCFNV